MSILSIFVDNEMSHVLFGTTLNKTKIALCGLRWFKLYVSRFKRYEMSNGQIFGLWRRFTKK